nr:MAG TPA: hypothetical protein [Bacteriophage sp.]
MRPFWGRKLMITGTPFMLGYSHEEVCCGGDRHERVVGKAEKICS